MVEPLTYLDFTYLAGSLLQLALVTAVAYRMGYRRYWLIAPWALSLVILAIGLAGLYMAARSVVIDLPLIPLLVRQASNATALPVFLALVFLAAVGLRRRPAALTEIF